MRTNTITIDIYNCEDLKNPLYSDLKNKVYEKHSDINVSNDYDWWGNIYYIKKQRLKKVGFEKIDMAFSGFWSQGDGASIAADIEAKKAIDLFNLSVPKNFESIEIEKISISRATYPRYVHENMLNINPTDFYLDPDLDDKLITEYEDFLNTLQNLVLGFLKNESMDLYRTLEEEYDYLTSEEAIFETLEANDYEFTKSGDIY